MPISKQQMASVRKSYATLARLEPMIEKAKACDIDCDEVERRRTDAMNRLKKINEVYGPDYPEGK